jgi:hypothetical protein
MAFCNVLVLADLLEMQQSREKGISMKDAEGNMLKYFVTIGLWKTDLMDFCVLNRKFTGFTDKMKYPCVCLCPGCDLAGDEKYATMTMQKVNDLYATADYEKISSSSYHPESSVDKVICFDGAINTISEMEHTFPGGIGKSILKCLYICIQHVPTKAIQSSHNRN